MAAPSALRALGFERIRDRTDGNQGRQRHQNGEDYREQVYDYSAWLSRKIWSFYQARWTNLNGDGRKQKRRCDVCLCHIQVEMVPLRSLKYLCSAKCGKASHSGDISKSGRCGSIRRCGDCKIHICPTSPILPPSSDGTRSRYFYAGQRIEWNQRKLVVIAAASNVFDAQAGKGLE